MMPALTDRDLVQSFREGQSAAAEQLYARYYSKVCALATHYLHSFHEAEDIAQEVFLKVIARKKILAFEEKAQLWSWLYRITVNMCHTHHQKKVRRREVGWTYWQLHEEWDEPVEPLSTNAENILIQYEEQDVLREKISHLPVHYQYALHTVYLQNRSYKEAAKLLGISIFCLGVQLSRAKKILARSWN